MKEFFTSPFGQKLMATIGAVGIYLLAHKFPDLSAELGMLAGGLGLGTFALHATPPAKKDPSEGA